LHHYLKNHFRQNKQLGSRDRKIISSGCDRKIISSGCYDYYRYALLLPNRSVEEQLALSFSITNEKNLLSDYLSEKYQIAKNESNSLSERLEFIRKQDGITPDVAFSFLDLLSKEIDKEAFAASMFQQPLVWIRIRKGFEKSVLDELKLKEIISFQSTENALGFAPAIPLTALESYLKGHFEIQDLSSQQTLSLLPDNCGTIVASRQLRAAYVGLLQWIRRQDIVIGRPFSKGCFFTYRPTHFITAKCRRKIKKSCCQKL